MAYKVLVWGNTQFRMRTAYFSLIINFFSLFQMSHFYDTEEGADNAVEDYIIRAEQNSITDRIYNYKNVRGSKLREGEKVKGLLLKFYAEFKASVLKSLGYVSIPSAGQYHVSEDYKSW